MTENSIRMKNVDLLIRKLISQFDQSLYKNAVYIFGVNFVPALIGFAFWWLASRLYSASEIGIASAVIAAISFLAGVAGMGVGTGIIRFLPGSEKPNGLLVSSYLFVILISIIVGIIYLLGLHIWSPDLAFLRVNWRYPVIFVVFILSISLGATVRATFVARRRSQYAFYYTLTTQLARLALLPIGISLGYLGLVGAVGFAFLIGLLAALLLFLPRVEPSFRLRQKVNLHLVKGLLLYSIGNYISDLIFLLPQTLLPLMVINMLGAQANGYAYIALMIGSLIASPGLALSRSAFAEGSNLYTQKESILIKAAISGFLLTAIIALLVFLATPLVLLIYGQSYALHAAPLLRLMALSAPLVVLNQVYFTYLRLVKQITRLVIISVIIVILCIGMAVLLMPLMGIAAAGTGVLLGNLAAALYFLAQLAINPIYQKRFVEITRSVFAKFKGIPAKIRDKI
jgi:O-antigen/teichoic acid export membrane protein